MTRGTARSIVLLLMLPLVFLLFSSPRAIAEDVRADVQEEVEGLRGELAVVERDAEETRAAWLKAKRRRGEGRTEEDRQAHERALFRLDHVRRKADRLRAVVGESKLDGRLAAVESVLEQGQPVDETVLAEVLALKAAFEDVRQGVSELFALDDDGRTTLHGAAEDEDARLAGRALAGGVNPDHPDDHGFTALHLAAWWGADEIVEQLIAALRTVDRRAITTPKDGDPLGCSERPMRGPTALHLACYTGRSGSVKALVVAGADPSLQVQWRDTGTG